MAIHVGWGMMRTSGRPVLSFLILLAILAPPGAVAAQARAITPVERERGYGMLRQLRGVLNRFYYDSTFTGHDMDALWYRATSAIDTATSWPSVTTALAAYLQGLEDSHTRFFPPMLTVEVDYGWSPLMVGEDCYVRSVRRGSDAERQGLQVGDKVLSLDGLRPTRQGIDLIWYVYHYLSPRAGMRLYVEHPDGSRASVQFEARVSRRPTALDYGNLEHLRMLDYMAGSGRVDHQFRTRDSVGLWRFDRFGADAGRYSSHMREASRHPWLIIDLRGNGGGRVSTLTQLLGHFTDTAFTAYTEHFRDSVVAHTVRPRAPVYRGQVLILIDSESASASEIFSRTLQQTGRAMVIGDRSMGAVQTSISLRLEETASNEIIPFGMQVTIQDILMADGEHLEGRGVLPNVPALPTGRDLAARRDPALQFALELAGIRVTAEEAARIFR